MYLARLALQLLIGCVLRLPREAAVPVVILMPPAIYALPAAWWGATAYTVGYIVLSLAWVIFLYARLEDQ